MATASDTCSLCHLPLSSHSHPIMDAAHAFCCHGCQAVFNILTLQGKLENFDQHPVFLQALRSGLISNPALFEHIQKQRQELEGSERERLHLEIAQMWCPSCAELIRLVLLKEKGVLHCTVDYATDLASIEFSPRYISKEHLLQLISAAGYQPLALDAPERQQVSADLYLRFGVAAFCALNLMMIAYALYATYFDYDGEKHGSLLAWLSLLISLPAIFYSGWPIWRRFFSSLKAGYFGMETLVVIGVSSAFGMSLKELLQGGTHVYFDSMSVIIAFVLLGKIIENKAKFSAKSALMNLAKSTPRRGRKRFPDGTFNFVPSKEIVKGDILLAYCGEKIALDGVVEEGEGACDESLMTGESIPVLKKKGSKLLSGTILVQGYVEYRVTKTLEESTLHKILEMAERDIGRKTVYVRAADLVVRWFVPVVICIACTAAWAYLLFPATGDLHPTETAWLRALAVLLISCPCAIGIAAPTAEAHLLNALAQSGAIVRNRGCLTHLGKETAIIFDKTGTATEGRFFVHSGLEGLEEKERLALRSLSMRSAHPVAHAIALTLSGDLQPVDKLEERPGYGIQGKINGELYYLGSARFMLQQGIQAPECIQKINGILSQVHFAKQEKLLATLHLGDQIRDGMAELVATLKPARVILLSGDNSKAVQAVAEQCGFDEWHAGCTPLEKQQFVDNLRKQGHIVAMIGDGINDAPALTSAHVGISVLAATDISIQVSDILLTTDRLQLVAEIRERGAKGACIVRQNLFWAFFYNVIGIGLAAIGLLSPLFAAFAMSISSLTVLFNARRLNKKT